MKALKYHVLNLRVLKGCGSFFRKQLRVDFLEKKLYDDVYVTDNNTGNVIGEISLNDG